MSKKATPADVVGENDYYRFDADWFRAQLRARGMSQADFGDALQRAKEPNVDPGEFSSKADSRRTMASRIMQGARPIRVGEVPILAAIFGVPPQEILRRLGVPLEAPDVPVAGVIGPGGKVVFETGRTTPAADWPNQNLVAYEVAAPDAELEIFDRGHVFAEPRDYVGADTASRLVVLALKTGAGLIGRAVRVGAASGDKTYSARIELWNQAKRADVDGIVAASPVRWIRLI